MSVRWSCSFVAYACPVVPSGVCEPGATPSCGPLSVFSVVYPRVCPTRVAVHAAASLRHRVD
uniref:Uncharacterized protein n=1 Tax=Anopheles albimanus TaxID=7167 RepID=A0A182FZD5_ANOAL